MFAHTIAVPTVVDRAIRFLDRTLLKPLTTWRARQIAIDELLSLDDHMLADIGVSRCEIPGIVAGQFPPRRAVNENKPSAAA